MNNQHDAQESSKAPRSYWFVGAAYWGNEDQTEDFLKKGIWRCGYEDGTFSAEVLSMQPGDRIAIKAAYTQKHDLPFNNDGGHSVSVMSIKAIGVITKNHKDGRTVDVEWSEHFDPVRKWYFHTYQKILWRVSPDEWMKNNLIDFAFNNADQDIDRFRNAPKWKERFGDTPEDEQEFKWTPFYEEFADKLLEHRKNRAALMQAIHTLLNKIEGISPLIDQPAEGKEEPLDDVCPFTVFALFNRGITDKKRIEILSGLAGFLDVEAPTPSSFESIPLLNNLKPRFFAHKYQRDENDINTLWELFATALKHADNPDDSSTELFSTAYDKALKCNGVGWNLSMGLYWIRPWKYVTLDSQSRTYISKKLGLSIDKTGEKGYSSANDYLKLLDDLEARFQEDAYPVHSFPALSLAAWNFKDADATDANNDTANETVQVASRPIPIKPYTVDDIISDGGFMDPESINKIIVQLHIKKNIILQGPPGTGKTWLAKKLAYALMGEKNESTLHAVQFHPNLSYEDFVRGWRPSGEGKLNLVDGPFLKMIDEAKKNVNTKYVMVIEEINRGNPAQIFGEMLTLLEADKRTPSEALEISYSRDSETIHIPANLYVIGTMNIADRSLALVDLALRRRFAFFDLQPTFGEPWRKWVNRNTDIDIAFLRTIEARLLTLNNEIANDTNLGPQFKIGHSYLTPPSESKIEEPRAWFRGIVESEIAPLLREYWFDDVTRAKKSCEVLVEGI